MTIQVNIKQAKDMIVQCIMAQLAVMVHGSPAIGKSAMVKQIADQYNLKLIDLRLSQLEPTDLTGFASINKVNNRSEYYPFNFLPIEGDKVPQGYTGWLLFLDEFNSANHAIQKAAYRLMLDREVGQHSLHKNVAVVAAGNLETDNAIVEEMPTPLQSRMIHLNLAVDYNLWCDHAHEQGFDYRIMGYLSNKPEMLYHFDPDHSDQTYPSPRTWEFLSRLIKDKEVSNDNLALYAGAVSEGVAREFLIHTQVYDKFPSVAEIKANPDTAKLPVEKSILHAVTGYIANGFTAETAKPFMTYIKRMPMEFQTLTLRAAIRRNRNVLSVPEVGAWASQMALNIF